MGSPQVYACGVGRNLSLAINVIAQWFTAWNALCEPHATTIKSGIPLRRRGGADSFGGTMRKRIELLGIVLVLVLGLMAALTQQASATAGTGHGWKYVSGVGLPDIKKACNTTDQMPDKFKDYFSIPPMVMTGDLQGCWYTKVDPTSVIDFANGWHFERGWEVFFDHNRSKNRFETTYTFQGQYDPTGHEIQGQCQHPIINRTGRGGLAGANGQLFFTDEIAANDADNRFPYQGYFRIS